MAYSKPKVYTRTMPSGTSVTSVFSLAQSYQTIYMEIGTMASVSTLEVFGSPEGTNFNHVVPLQAAGDASSSAGYTIQTASTGHIYQIPGGFPFYQIRAVSMPTIAVTFKLICTGK